MVDSKLRVLPEVETSTCKSSRRGGTGSYKEEVQRQVMVLEKLVKHVLGRCSLVSKDLGKANYPVDDRAWRK